MVYNSPLQSSPSSSSAVSVHHEDVQRPAVNGVGIAVPSTTAVANTSESSFMPGSMEHVRSCDAYPLPQPARINGLSRQDSDARLKSKTQSSTTGDAPPFTPLPGEGVSKWDRFTGVNGAAIYLTNYRLFVLLGAHAGFYNVPLSSIDTVETRDLQSITVTCKDGTVFRILADNSAIVWYKELSTLTAQSRTHDDHIFAYRFYAWATHPNNMAYMQKAPIIRLPADEVQPSTTVAEFHRLMFDRCGCWRVSDANGQFALCPSYPRHLIVPCAVLDPQLKDSAKFRLLQRLPVCVWRHRTHGSVLMRSAQPAVGLAFFGWRSEADERILQTAVACMTHSCAKVNKPCADSNGVEQSSTEQSNGTMPPLLILDARSYTSAWANKAKGGGFENTEYYTDCEVAFMGMANIHNIRTSFQQFRTLLSGMSNENYLTGANNCQWYAYIVSLLQSSVRCVSALHDERRSVLVHCSDGWDRTAQIVSTAKLLLDPYYRTIEGFRQLVDYEWVQFGHKFADRCAVVNGDPNERAPVFLQWLDAVHQIQEQFAVAFEFNRNYLVKLALHTYSTLFGTFLCNSLQERQQRNVDTRTYSVWSLLHANNDECVNVLYKHTDAVLWPRISLQDMVLWQAVYCQGSVPAGANHLASLSQQHPVVMSGSMERSTHRAHSAESLLSASLADVSLPVRCDSPASPYVGESGVAAKLSGASLPRADSDSKLCVTQTTHYGHHLLNGHNHNELTSADISDVVEDLMMRVVGGRQRTNTMPIRSSTPHEHAVSDTGMLRIDCNGGDMADAAVQFAACALDTTPLILNGGSMQDMMFPMSDVDDEHTDEVVGIRCTHMITSTSEISDSTTGVCIRLNKVVDSMRTPLRRSPSAASLRTQTIARLIDCDGLVRRDTAEEDQLRKLKLAYQRAFDALDRELQQLRCDRYNHRRVVACTTCRGDLDDDVEPESFAASCAPSITQSSWESVEQQLPTKWIPDHAVTHCMGCDRRFWGYNRKHHCRACGKVFCSQCSAYECVVPSEQLFKPVRVCAGCYGRLTHIPDARSVNTGGKQVCAGQVMSKHDDVRANGKASASELRVKVA